MRYSCRCNEPRILNPQIDSAMSAESESESEWWNPFSWGSELCDIPTDNIQYLKSLSAKPQAQHAIAWVNYIHKLVRKPNPLQAMKGLADRLMDFPPAEGIAAVKGAAAAVVANALGVVTPEPGQLDVNREGYGVYRHAASDMQLALERSPDAARELADKVRGLNDTDALRLMYEYFVRCIYKSDYRMMTMALTQTYGPRFIWP